MYVCSNCQQRSEPLVYARPADEVELDAEIAKIPRPTTNTEDEMLDWSDRVKDVQRAFAAKKASSAFSDAPLADLSPEELARRDRAIALQKQIDSCSDYLELFTLPNGELTSRRKCANKDCKTPDVRMNDKGNGYSCRMCGVATKEVVISDEVESSGVERETSHKSLAKDSQTEADSLPMSLPNNDLESLFANNSRSCRGALDTTLIAPQLLDSMFHTRIEHKGNTGLRGMAVSRAASQVQGGALSRAETNDERRQNVREVIKLACFGSNDVGQSLILGKLSTKPNDDSASGSPGLFPKRTHAIRVCREALDLADMVHVERTKIALQARQQRRQKKERLAALQAASKTSLSANWKPDEKDSKDAKDQAPVGVDEYVGGVAPSGFDFGPITSDAVWGLAIIFVVAERLGLGVRNKQLVTVWNAFFSDEDHRILWEQWLWKVKQLEKLEDEQAAAAFDQTAAQAHKAWSDAVHEHDSESGLEQEVISELMFAMAASSETDGDEDDRDEFEGDETESESSQSVLGKREREAPVCPETFECAERPTKRLCSETDRKSATSDVNMCDAQASLQVKHEPLPAIAIKAESAVVVYNPSNSMQLVKVNAPGKTSKTNNDVKQQLPKKKEDLKPRWKKTFKPVKQSQIAAKTRLVKTIVARLNLPDAQNLTLIYEDSFPYMFGQWKPKVFKRADFAKHASESLTRLLFRNRDEYELDVILPVRWMQHFVSQLTQLAPSVCLRYHTGLPSSNAMYRIYEYELGIMKAFNVFFQHSLQNLILLRTKSLPPKALDALNANKQEDRTIGHGPLSIAKFEEFVRMLCTHANSAPASPSSIARDNTVLNERAIRAAVDRGMGLSLHERMQKISNGELSAMNAPSSKTVIKDTYGSLFKLITDKQPRTIVTTLLWLTVRLRDSKIGGAREKPRILANRKFPNPADNQIFDSLSLGQKDLQKYTGTSGQPITAARAVLAALIFTSRFV